MPSNQAVEGLEGSTIDGFPDNDLFAGPAEKREQRQQALRDKFEALKTERQQKYMGVNLFVKNLDDSIDDEKLRTEFSQFGSIASAKVMTEDKDGAIRSKGFGFVCFETPEEATKAITDMNGRMINSKPIFVALAQRKEDRRVQLEAQMVQRQQQAMRMQQLPPGAGMQPGMMMAPGMMPGMMQPGMMRPGMQPGMMMPGMPRSCSSSTWRSSPSTTPTTTRQTA